MDLEIGRREGERRKERNKKVQSVWKGMG